MTPSLRVFSVVARYLDHGIGLRELQEWMVRHTTWLMTGPRDTGTELAGLVELDLAEISAGVGTEEELREDIHDFLSSHHTLQFDLDGEDQTASASRTMDLAWAFPQHQSAGIRFEVASA